MTTRTWANRSGRVTAGLLTRGYSTQITEQHAKQAGNTLAALPLPGGSGHGEPGPRRP